MRFVIARASDMKRSTPKMMTMLATGTLPVVASVAANVMNPAPVTPAAPLEVSSSTPRMPSCSPSVSTVPVACARKRTAMVR